MDDKYVFMLAKLDELQAAYDDFLAKAVKPTYEFLCVYDCDDEVLKPGSLGEFEEWARESLDHFLVLSELRNKVLAAQKAAKEQIEHEHD